MSERTHAKQVKANQEHRRLTPDQIGREKNEKTRARGLERKAANIAKMVAAPKRSAKEQIARLDAFGHTATKERKRLAKKTT